MPEVIRANPVTLNVPKPALTTDFLGTGRSIHEFAPRMKDAGFEQVLWCEQWDGDYAYSPEEVAGIDRILGGLGLKVRDLHATEGAFYGQWVSPNEEERRKGVDLIHNRIDMAADLGAETIVLHAPHHEMPWEKGPRAYEDSMRRSLSEVETHARDKRLRIALENTDWKGQGKIDNFEPIKFALDEFPDDYLGICYDSGHGNLMRVRHGNHIGQMDETRDRLIALHLHDNNGMGATRGGGRYKILEGKSQDDDMHRLLFTGTVDWNRLARIIAESSYQGPMMMEASMKYDPTMNPMDWLQKAMQTGFTFSAMVESHKVADNLGSQLPIIK